MAVLDTLFLYNYKYNNNSLWHAESAVSSLLEPYEYRDFIQKMDSKSLIITTPNIFSSNKKLVPKLNAHHVIRSSSPVTNPSGVLTNINVT